MTRVWKHCLGQTVYEIEDNGRGQIVQVRRMNSEGERSLYLPRVLLFEFARERFVRALVAAVVEKERTVDE